jgi:hypothetical protein
MAATGAVQPTLSLVAQTCHGTPEHAIPNQDACGIKKRGVSAAFSIQMLPAYACGWGSRPGSGSGRGRGLPAGGTAEARGVLGSSTDSRLGFLPLSRS